MIISIKEHLDTLFSYISFKTFLGVVLIQYVLDVASQNK